MTRAAISQDIWDFKYRHKAADGTPIDRSIEDTWARVAAALAEGEAPAERETWGRRFYQAMKDFRFLPAGRILAGAGTGRRVTLFNCFVMGTLADDMTGIFDGLKEAALTMQQGGGIGFDFSTLRPKGAPVLGVGADASGPLSFMDVWDAMCRTIMSAGARRGAMMATMACDHPDIEAFIAVKGDSARLRMFNLSVLISDAFMDAVKTDSEWDLVFNGQVHKTLRARALWDQIMQATYAYAEPGVIFIDRINALNNLHYCETIRATNPCGEQPLPPYGACLLSSVNLARLVTDPFTERARLDLDALEELVSAGVRMMDNVIDVSNYPLEAQQEEARAKRRIGLGVTGLADALIMCRVRYGSAEAVELTRHWLARIQDTAYWASVRLAEEKGAFPLFDKDAFLASETVKSLSEELRSAIATHGIRNALLTSIAPTGTISLFAENISSGIEPVFSFTYTRKVLMPDGDHQEHTVEDYAYRLYRELHGADAPIPDYFVSAQTISPQDHVAIQAAAQPHVDSAISKTINVPEAISFEDFKSVYMQAYETGCKGCTTYRPNDITGSVLTTSQAPAAPEPPKPEPRLPAAPQQDGSVVFLSQPLDRPGVLEGNTYKVSWPESDHAIYITINDIVKDGRRLPFEIFINSKNMEHFAWTVALTRMISAVFRRGGDVTFVVDELQAVFDPRGGHWMSGRYVPSLLAAIGDVIEEHLVSIGFLPDTFDGFLPDEANVAHINHNLRASAGGSGARIHGSEPRPRQCPRCGQPALLRVDNCDSCRNCGYSTCS